VREAEVKAHVDELIDWVGLKARRDVRPAVLSGGEQQRVAIARAVIARPDILLADEPTGNVDPEMAGRLLHLFHELNRLGTTVVVATHAAHLLARVPSAITFRLEHGSIIDPLTALRNQPALHEARGALS
jgi:cell division transport system ATP-binding protein